MACLDQMGPIEAYLGNYYRHFSGANGFLT